MERSLLQIPQQYWPPVADLPRDMQTIVEALEEDFPGQGMTIIMSLAQRVGGAWYYIQMLEKLSKAWRDDTIRAMYDTKDYSAKDLGRIFRLSHRQVQNILAAPGSKKELEDKQLKLFG